MAGKMTSVSEGNSHMSDFGGFTEEDLVDNISVVPDSDPDSSDIEISSVESSDISDLGEHGLYCFPHESELIIKYLLNTCINSEYHDYLCLM